MDNVLLVYCDGGARGNPGPSAGAFVVLENNKIIHKGGKYLGETTNNVAEYESVILALEWIGKTAVFSKTPDKVFVFLDSQLIVNQLTGVFRIKNKRLLQRVMAIKKLERTLSYPVVYKNIPRIQNRMADFLVNQVLDRKTKSVKRTVKSV